MSGKIKVYTKAECPYCRLVKDLLRIKGVAYTECAITENPDQEFPGMRCSQLGSVPKVFVNNRLIGGCSELFALDEKGELDRILNLANPLGGSL